MAIREFDFDWDKELGLDGTASESRASASAAADPRTESILGPDPEAVGRERGQREVNFRRESERAGLASREGSFFGDSRAQDRNPGRLDLRLPNPRASQPTMPRVPGVTSDPNLPPVPKIISPDDDVWYKQPETPGGGLLPPGFEGPLMPGGAGVPGQKPPATEAQGGEGFADIDELRAEPWTTEFEQAAISRADELVGQKWNTVRQARTMDLARRNIDPTSPLWQSEMGKIDRDQAREVADFRRKLQIEKVDRRQRNLEQARGLEQNLHNMERQGIFDLLAIIAQNPGFIQSAGNMAGQGAGISAALARSLGLEANEAYGSAGDMFAELMRSLQPQY